jgi:hypothetical protein
MPLEFSADKNIAWKARLGDGVGSAIVKNGVVYATAWRAMKVAVHAFDAATGAPKWKSEFDTGTLPRITPPNSHAALHSRHGWRARVCAFQHHRPARLRFRHRQGSLALLNAASGLFDGLGRGRLAHRA